jgi:hypothetical protein
LWELLAANENGPPSQAWSTPTFLLLRTDLLIRLPRR